MTIFRTLLALAVLTVPVAATAASPARESIAVEVGDLDLNTDKGQRVFAMRIQRAAKAICEAEVLANLPQTIRIERKCLRETQARANAVARIMTGAGDTSHTKGG